MAIISWPNAHTKRVKNVSCAICHELTPLNTATAGLYYSNGMQAFACEKHFWNNEQLIVGWANFAIEQSAAVSQDPSFAAAHMIVQRKVVEA